MKRLILLFILVVGLGPLMAQELSDEEAAALAKASQNPLAKMISVPFQNNTTYGFDGQVHNVLNIQPVIPISLGSKVNLINRVIVPVISNPRGNGESKTGLGDINYTAWFSPADAGNFLWGLGPVMQLPSATWKDLGSHEIGIGPSAVALLMVKKWVTGFVVNNVWTFTDVKENKFLFQYFVNYNLPHGTYLVSAPILTSNWNAESGEQWIVPFGGGLGKVFRIGKLPINFNAQVYYNAAHPTGWGEWQSRFQLQFMFPK